MNSIKADLLIRSDQIITGSKEKQPLNGFIAIKDGHIIEVAEGLGQSYLGEETILYTLNGQSVTPALTDSHCFFIGYALERYAPLAVANHPMESLCPLMDCMLEDLAYMETSFLNYQSLLHSKGVLAVKEMCFDDTTRFAQLLKHFMKKDLLKLRVHFMSQPVLKSIDIAHGKTMQEQFNSSDCYFSGYNFMTDGSVGDGMALLSFPYLNHQESKENPYDFKAIAKSVHEADQAGFRVSLHAQGDLAISKAIAILSECLKSEDGKLRNRHAMTDLELLNESHAQQMGQLGIIAEIYPQISSLATRQEKLDMIVSKLGEEASMKYWHRKVLSDHQVPLSCGTDLPLLIPSLPEALYFGSEGHFKDGLPLFNHSQCLSPLDMIKGYTSGGAYNLGLESITGQLKTGLSADLVIWDGDLLQTTEAELLKISPSKTLFKGQVVFEKSK